MTDSGAVCPKCDSLIKDDLCPNCGFSISESASVSDKAVSKTDASEAVSLNPEAQNSPGEEKSDSEYRQQELAASYAYASRAPTEVGGFKRHSKDVDKSSEDPKPKSINPDYKETAVNSIFADMASKSGVSQSVSSIQAGHEKDRSRLFFLIPASLFLLLAGIAAFAYYQFVYKSSVILNPVAKSLEEVLSISVTESEIPAANSILNGTDKTVDLNAGLKEGNFEAYPFAKVIPPDVNMAVQLFDVKKIFERFISKDKYDALLKEFDLSDNDIEVYFSDGFAIVYPYSDLSTWGYVQYVKNKDFIEKRLADFEKKKESDKYPYKGYYAQLVEIASSGSDLSLETPEEEDSSVELPAAAAPEAPAGEDKTDKLSSDGRSAESLSVMLFLAVSNSKEFLDRMKEISEGNLSSLADDINFVQSKADLPLVGGVYVYRNDDTPVWSLFLEKITPFFDYTGLDKILKEIKTAGTVFYSKDGKLKIQGHL